MPSSDTFGMELSIIIPTRSRLDRLEACLKSLAEQDAARESFEVLVGVDGDDQGEGELFERLLGSQIAGGAFSFEHRGPAATRNQLIARARGRTLLLLNDDVVADPALVRTHIESQLALSRPAMILGSAPWAITKPDRLFDRLIRETSMVFFYDQMTDQRVSSEPDRDWGFRHAWTLNLSVASEAVQAVGGFCEDMTRPVYEDLELGWRLQQQFEMPVLYRPRAVVTHVHRYEPQEFLVRDAVLGHQAWRLAEVSPHCARAMFNVDVRSDEDLAYARDFLTRHETAARRHLPMFLGLGDIPASALAGEHAGALLGMIFEQTLLLRRYLWRRGQVAASEGRSIEDAASWLELEVCAGH